MNPHFKYLSIFFVFVFLSACKNPKPRKPVTKTSNTFIKASIKRNKIINTRQEALFKKIIKRDTLHKYINSKLGFWYYLKNQQDTLGVKPKKGDEVVINYQIRSIDNKIIIPYDQLGSRGLKDKKDRLYKVDGENFIQGVQEAVKLLKKGDSAVLLLPSNKAFGVTGFQDYIAPNQPLIIELYLKDIKPKNQK